MFDKHFSKKKPLISVVINCYNGERHLEQCIKSVINQRYKNWEIIFFDNNSSDSSKKILKRFRDKRIKYFYSYKTFKLYKARNLAVKKCKGKFISFLDVDDWWVTTKLSTQVSILEKNPDVDIIYSNLFLFFQKNKQKKIWLKEINNSNFTQRLIDKFEMPILTTMVKKSFFKKLKFNNNYTIIGDLDFFVRASLKANILGLKKPLAYYRYHEKNLTKKRIDLNISELENWVKYISKNKNFIKFNFKNTYKLIELLKIEKLIKEKKILESIKTIFQFPLRLSKIKFLILIFFTIFNLKKKI